MYDGNDEKFVDFRYDSKSHEYFIKDIGIPATLKLDARYVRPSNSIYALQNVSWDL